MSAMTKRELAVLVTAGVLALLGAAYLAAIAPDVVEVLANRPPWLGEDEA